MRLLKKLQSRIHYLDAPSKELVERAFHLAAQAHQEQKRHSGEPYITHPVAVACILAEMHFDVQTVIAAILHDVIEDSEYTREDLADQFGDEIANIVEGVSKLTKIEFRSRIEAQADNFRKMILAMIEDIRVILVKLADRLHNMRTLGPLRADKKCRIARETLEIYAPIARRLGMRKVCVELEELGFAGQYPNRQHILSQAVHKMRGDRQQFLDFFHHSFQETLIKAGLPSCQIMGREKHLYSIYRKMKEKRHSFKQVLDVYAFRIIVDSLDTCYRVLGLLHSLYKPVPERFKDYIAIPKANGYQSLHTTLFGPYGMPIEVQIRTAAMDEQANNGVAAHRLYKAASPGESGLHNQTERWLKTLSELQSSSSSSLEFIESVKVDLFPAEIYVFTPKGRIKELPNESTVIDFAYSVHTDVGNACQSAMVDKKSVPLSTVLHSGQTVEVVTAEDVEPDSSWLEFVVTGKARAAIRHQLKSRHRGQAIYKGREMLKKALSQFILSTPQIDVDSWQQLLDELGLRHRDALYAEMGLGNYAPMLVARRLVGFSEEAYARLQKPSALTELSPSLIEGGEGQVIHYASCCHPIPGDEIVGVLESSGGIVIHRHHCPTLLKRNSRLEQLMHMQWQPNLVGLYTAKLLCKLDEKLGAVAEVVAVVDQYHIELKDLVVIERLAEEVTVMMTLQVENCHQLMAIIDELSELAVVRQVTRS